MTACPTVLTESGYFSNASDFNNIISDSANNQKAKAMVKGIADYFISIQYTPILDDPEPEPTPPPTESSQSSSQTSSQSSSQNSSQSSSSEISSLPPEDEESSEVSSTFESDPF